jgi:plasmid stabilization system protein ParE
LPRKTPDAARRAASAIRDGIQIVVDHPDAGRPANSMDPEFQEWRISFGVSGYVALDRLQKKSALVVAVLHQKEVRYQPS